MATAAEHDEKPCSSALAIAWEQEHTIRRRAVKLRAAPQSSQVQLLILGHSVCGGRLGFNLFDRMSLESGFETSFLYLPSKVCVFGECVNRDTLKNNRSLLSLAVKFLGLRVTVPTCQMHIRALYDYMDISCPRTLFLYIEDFF